MTACSNDQESTSDSKPHYYKATYEVACHVPGGLLAEEVPEGRGAADALVVASLVRNANNTYGCTFASFDGDSDGGDLDPGELFYVWVALAGQLAQKLKVGTGRQELCSEVQRIVAESLSAARSSRTSAER